MVRNHLAPQKTAVVHSAKAPKHGDDVVICAYARTALCKAKKGSFRNTAPEMLLSKVLRQVVDDSGCDPSKIEDIMVGNVLQPGAGAATSRMGQFLADLPHTISLATVNRQCSSGLQAIMIIANSIRGGHIDIGIGSGVESMSIYDMNDSVKADALSDAIFENENARNCLMSMGVTSENVAE